MKDPLELAREQIDLIDRAILDPAVGNRFLALHAEMVAAYLREAIESRQAPSVAAALGSRPSVRQGRPQRCG